MAVTFDLLSKEYGWTDEQILDLPLRRIRQAVAAIGRRQWLDDIAHRRLETAKLRTLCGYIAATIDTAGGDNPMLTMAPDLNLGDGTLNAAPGEFARHHPRPDTTGPDEAGGEAARVRPGARLSLAELPDAPAGVRAGAPAAMPDGLRALPLQDVGALFGGGL